MRTFGARYVACVFVCRVFFFYFRLKGKCARPEVALGCVRVVGVVEKSSNCAADVALPFMPPNFPAVSKNRMELDEIPACFLAGSGQRASGYGVAGDRSGGSRDFA